MFKSRIVKIIWPVFKGNDFIEVIDDITISINVKDLCEKLNISIDEAEIKTTPFVYKDAAYCLITVKSYPIINTISNTTQLIKQETLNKDPYIKGAPHDILSSH